MTEPKGKLPRLADTKASKSLYDKVVHRGGSQGDSQRGRVFGLLDEYLPLIEKDRWFLMARLTDMVRECTEDGKFYVCAHLVGDVRYRTIRQYVEQWCSRAGLKFHKQSTGSSQNIIWVCVPSKKDAKLPALP